MNPSQRGLYAVHASAALIVCSLAVSLLFSVPEFVADYVKNGLMLPLFRYGLLFPLIACGIILSAEYRPIVLILLLAVLASVVWFGLELAVDIVLRYEPLVEHMVYYPVVSSALATIVGGALLLPSGLRKWIVPLVTAICGLGLGLFVILESPFDEYHQWFTSAGKLGGVAVIVVSIPLGYAARRACPEYAVAIVERIAGSWLIAAGVLLAALAIAPQSLPELELMLTEPPDVDALPR